MSAWIAYSEAYDPPAPVVPVRIAQPDGQAAVLAPGLVDTGADCTLIPANLARSLRLPLVNYLDIRGVGGGGGRVPMHAGRVQIAGTEILARLIVYEDDVIVGRDLLNRVVSLLDGPKHRVRMTSAEV